MTKMRLLLPVATAIVLTAAAAISFARGAEIKAGEVTIIAAWARATPLGATIGAAYVTVENKGSADDRIVSAASPLAASVTPHQTSEENGVATMRPLEGPIVPAGRAAGNAARRHPSDADGALRASEGRGDYAAHSCF